MGQIVLDHEDLAKRVRAQKVSGKSVIVTNGCFDLLHVGHVRALLDAGRRGDCLVVALNSDASVRALKGPDRPVQPELERAEIVAAIAGVAYVTLFAEESVGPLLRRLRPDFLAKGTDYDASNLPERDVLKEIGAQLLTVGDPKDHSTIDLLARIRGGAKAPGKDAAKAAAPAAARGAKAPAKTVAKVPARPAKPASRKGSPAKGAAPKSPLRKSAAAAAGGRPDAVRRKARGDAEAHA